MYRHTQRSSALLILIALSGLIPLALLLFGPGARYMGAVRVPLVGVMIVLLLAGLSFSSLTIEVGDGKLAWHFGSGLFRKSVPLDAIARVEATTTSFLEGWGIHLTRRGWLYNVAGREAVLVTLRDDKRFLLGTDESERLIDALGPPSR